jgi:hypothetical protein
LNIEIKEGIVILSEIHPWSWDWHYPDYFFTCSSVSIALMSILLPQSLLFLTVSLLLVLSELIEFFGIVPFSFGKGIKGAHTRPRRLNASIPIPLSVILFWLAALNFHQIAGFRIINLASRFDIYIVDSIREGWFEIRAVLFDSE